MTWFYCDHCCDTVKKPKIAAHARRCHSATFTCIDCSYTFDLTSIQAHTVCVTEKEKYVDGVTKLRGSQGSEASPVNEGKSAEVLGQEHLTTSPPWRCTLCKVKCTSETTMQAHAAGQKHRRKSRAYAAANADRYRNTMVLEKAAGNTDHAAMLPQGNLDTPTAVEKSSQQHSDVDTCKMKSGKEKENKQCRQQRLALDSSKGDAMGEENSGEIDQRQGVNEDIKPASVAPVVRKLIKKHGGTMKLQQLIGAINKKKKRQMGLTGADSMNQVLEAIFNSTGSGYDVLVVQKQAE